MGLIIVFPLHLGRGLATVMWKKVFFDRALTFLDVNPGKMRFDEPGG